MNTVLIPQRVTVDALPVVSAIRVGTGSTPGEFVAVVDRGDDHHKRYGTVRVYVWPDGRVVAGEGRYDLSLSEAHQDLLERTKLLPAFHVEAVVESREPYQTDRTTVFVNGELLADVGADVPVRARVVIAYTADIEDDPDAEPSAEDLAALSPAAARHLRELYAAAHDASR